jgi:sporulation protein YtfJ
MDKHPIGELMEVTMGKLRGMVDVNTIVGQPITTADGITLIPISKVSFGFAAGGSDFQTKNARDTQQTPFGGGSGAGVKIDPVSFVVIKNGDVRVLSANSGEESPLEKAADMLPGLIDKIKEHLPKKNEEGQEEA